MNIWSILITLVILIPSIFLCAWLRKKLKNKLEIQTIDVLVVGFIFASLLLLSGKITDFELASMKIKTATNEGIKEIEKIVDSKLNEINKQQKIAVDQIKKEQKVSSLWIQVLQTGYMTNPVEAIDFLQEIISIEESALAYGQLAYTYQRVAYPYQDGENKKQLLRKSENAYKKAYELGNDGVAANIANITAYFDEEEESKEWLQKAEDSNSLSSYDEILNFDYLTKYRNKPWFKELKWKEYK